MSGRLSLRPGILLAALCLLLTPPSVESASNKGADDCLQGVDSLSEVRRHALGRALRTLGFDTGGHALGTLACELGAAARTLPKSALRDGLPPAAAWRLGPDGIARWLRIHGTGRSQAASIVEDARDAVLLIYEDASWYPGSTEPTGDIVRVRTEWLDSGSSGRFAERAERALRGESRMLDRIRDWRVGAGGENVEIEVLARAEVETEPIGADPWQGVRFGGEDK